MKGPAARTLLGLIPEPTALDAGVIGAAFALAVKAAHPDNGGAGADMDQLKQARDELLRQVVAGGDFACRQCSGKGTVPARLGVRTCGACRGTGERNGG